MTDYMRRLRLLQSRRDAYRSLHQALRRNLDDLEAEKILAEINCLNEEISIHKQDRLKSILEAYNWK